MNGSCHQFFTKCTYPRHHQGWFSPQGGFFSLLLTDFFCNFVDFSTIFLVVSKWGNPNELGVKYLQVQNIYGLFQGFSLRFRKMIQYQTIFSYDGIWNQPISFELSFLLSIMLGMLILFDHMIINIELMRLNLLIVAYFKLIFIFL